MGSRLSLRARLGIQAGLLFLVVLGAFGAVVYVSMARGLRSSTDNALRLSTARVAAAVSFEDGRPVLPSDFENVTEGAAPGSREAAVVVQRADGGTLYSFGMSRDLLGETDLLSGARSGHVGFTDLTAGREDEPLRAYAEPLRDDGRVLGVVAVAQSAEQTAETLGLLRLLLFVSIPVVVVISGVLGYLLAGRALAPVDRITRTAARISAEDLSTRIGRPERDDEVGRLAATFDAMLERLQRSFERERRFVADASHELRTPLAAMRAIIGYGRERDRTPEEYRAELADLDLESQRMTRVADQLLQLTRDESDPLRSHDTIDLSALLGSLLDSSAATVAAKGLDLLREIEPGLTLTGDEDAFIRLLLNLLDNAIKYTDRGTVTVRARLDGQGAVCVTVEDTGCGIAEDDSSRVFDRFYRADESRSEAGTGLGLAIARSIARAHGGEVTVASKLGVGSTFTVCLPAVEG